MIRNLSLETTLASKLPNQRFGKLCYFLGIEVAQSKDDAAISQRKYPLDILEETRMLNCELVNTPMDPNVKLLPDQT